MNNRPKPTAPTYITLAWDHSGWAQRGMFDSASGRTLADDYGEGLHGAQ